MKMINLLSCLATVFILSTACEKNEESTTPVIDKFGEIITLKFGETTEINGAAFTVAFDKIVDDSRCPTGAECFWEGQAEINLLVNKNQNVEVIMRSGHENLAKDTMDNFVYTLVEVNPYPDAKGTLPIPAADYSIDIQIDKL